MVTLAVAACAALGAAMAQAPAGWQDTHRRAVELLLDDKAVEAIAVLERAVSEAPDFEDARYTLASAHESHGRKLGLEDPPRLEERRRHLEQAAAHLRRLAEGRSDYRSLAVMKLMMLYGEDDLDEPREAVAFARQFVALDPQSVMGHVMLARGLRALGDNAAATQALLAARNAVGPEGEHPLAVSIVEYLVGGAPKGDSVPVPPAMAPDDLRALIEYVEPIFDRAIAEDPENRMASMAKASVLLLRAQRLETDPARRKALEEEADRLVFRQRSEADGPAEDAPAMAFFDLPSPEFDAVRAEADALMERKEYDQAVKVYDDFITSHPTSVEAHYARVGVLLAGGRGDLVPGALAAARRALPGTADVRHHMGSRLLDVARGPELSEADVRTLLGEATVLLDEALALAPGRDAFTALVTKRLVLTEQARHETDAATVARLTAEAVSLATRAEELAGPRPGWPAGSAAVEAEAAVLEARGQYAQAAAVYDTLLSSQPGLLHGHVERLRLLVAAGSADLVGPSLQAARTAARTDVTSRHAAGHAYWDLVYRTPALAPAAAQALLAEAVMLFDEVLAIDPDHAETLAYKSLALRQQASRETNAARAKRLTADADRLREQAEAVMRNRQP